MVLASITTRSMQEHDVLATLTRLLIEDLASSPQRRLDISIAAYNSVLLKLWLLVCRRRSGVGIMQQLENTAPDMSPVRESTLQTLL